MMGMHRKTRIFIVAAVAVAIVVALAIALSRTPQAANSGPSGSGGILHVVAAENFWGSLAAQIGGAHVDVRSLVSDPNADPHEYEASAADARAVAQADYVIENGAGYDSWMDRLIGAGQGSRSDRKTLNVAALVGVQEGGNPHLWYDPGYVNAAAAHMAQDLAALDPANAAYYEANYQTLQASLALGYQGDIAQIKAQFGGAKVAATEDIFSYLANAAGLDLVSPKSFISAVAEGNDPPPASVVQFEDQLRSGQVKVLVYNEQTVTPLTDSMRQIAAQSGIPVVGITETMQPPGADFQDWMGGQVTALMRALSSGK